MLGEINPVAFRLFGMPIYWYAVIIVGGIMLAVWLSGREAERVGLKKDDVVDFMLWGLPSAIIGARLYYVLFQWRTYVDHPLEIFMIRNGGMAIYGGLIGGALALFFYTRYHFISTWTFLDIAAPSVMIAQAIGRWGNFVNQEAYGPETTQTFLESLHLPPFIIENMYIDHSYRQPTFLYESIWNMAGFLLLLFLRRKPQFLKQGEVFLLYLIWYAFGRFFIEGLRTDSLYLISHLRISQVLSAVLFFGAIVTLFVRRRRVAVPFYTREHGKK